MPKPKKDRFVPMTSTAMESLRGYVVASYEELVRVFGEPNSLSDEYKVSTEWELRDTKTGDRVRLYDYKDTIMYASDLPSVEEFRSMPSYEWHIGGQVVNFEALEKFLSEKLDRPVTCIRANW